MGSGLLTRLPLSAQLRLEHWRHLPLWSPDPPFYREQDLAEVPFFVVGAGRSGNTLLRRVLMTHPDVAIPPESYVLRQTIRTYQRHQRDRWEDVVDRVVSCFESHPEFSTWQTDLAPVRVALDKLPEEERSYQHIIRAVYHRYMETHRPRATRWGDKTPMNTLGLPALMRAFPQAQWIHLQRDGRDVVASYLDAGIYRSREKAMERWVVSERYAAAAAEALPPEQFLNVRYLDLVSAPGPVIDEVQRFLGLDVMHDLHLQTSETALGDAERYAHHVNVHKPITPRSVGRWKHHEAFREPVPSWFARALDAAGYDPAVRPAVERHGEPGRSTSS